MSDRPVWREEQDELNPSSLGQFIKLERCDKYLAWELITDDPFERDDRGWEQQRLSPLYAETGTRFEHNQLEALLDSCLAEAVIGPDDDSEAPKHIRDRFSDTWEEHYAESSDQYARTIRRVKDESPGYTAVAFQAPLEGRVGAWTIHGFADIITIRSTGDGAEVTIYEVKSSPREQTHHRIQAACYSLITKRLIDDATDISFAGKIISREQRVDREGLENIDSFELDVPETDVRILTQKGGRLDRVVNNLTADEIADGVEPESPEPESVTNRISPRCGNCPYHDLCYTNAVESEGLELLGIAEGTQEELEELGVTSLSDLAGLYEHGDWIHPTEDNEIDILEPNRVRDIEGEIGLRDLRRLSHAAHVFAQDISPDDRPGRPEYINQSGRNLPADTTSQLVDDDSDWEPDYPDHSLIRIYLYVQEDNIRDRISLLGAYVTNTETGEAEGFAEVTDGLPEELDDKNEAEIELVEGFLDCLDEVVESVAPEFPDDDRVPDDHGMLHVYLYSPQQRQSLVKAAKRYPDNEAFDFLRGLLGLRRDIDQEMVSIIQRDFRMRHLLRFAGLGLLQSAEQWERRDERRVGEMTGNEFDWIAYTDDGIFPLHQIFDEGFSENSVSYSDSGDTIRLDLESGIGPTHQDGYEDTYPLSHRYVDQIPLEYIWAGLGKLDTDWVDESRVDDETAADLREKIRRYKYEMPGSGSDDTISSDLLELMAEYLAQAVEHIEASIHEGYKEGTVSKESLPIDDLVQSPLGDAPLAVTAREYLDLEHGAEELRLRNYWRQSVEWRLTGGNSLAFECTDPPGDDPRRIRGELWTGDFDERYDTDVQSMEEDDWIVMTTIDTASEPIDEPDVDDVMDIGSGPLVKIQSIEEDGTVVLDAPWNRESWNWPGWGYPYMMGHDRFTGPGGDGDVIVSEGDRFVLDPSLDDVTSYHSSRALDNAGSNHVLDWLNGLLVDADPEEMEIEFCDRVLLQEFIDDVFTTADSVDYEPRNRQPDLIRAAHRHLVVVQGPPGTGKTSYTVTPAVLSRAYAFEQSGRNFAGTVSALSHDAVDEVWDNVREVAASLRDEGHFENLKLVRVRPAGLPDESVPYDEREEDQLAEHIEYQDDDDDDVAPGAARLRQLCEKYIDVSAEAEEGSEVGRPRQLILFGPPTSIRGAVDQMAEVLVDEDDLERDDDEDYDATVWELLEHGPSDLFDLSIVDEASMMDLPLLFLAGAFLDAEGQMILAGDHRQMQPIRAHEWEAEDRERIEETVPFFSALDYIRFLRGDIDELDFIERDSPALDEGVADEDNATLPIYRLNESFRLPHPVAELLTDLFYDEDGIDLDGVTGRDPLPPAETADEDGPIATILNPDEWVTVVIHDSEHERDSSAIEGIMTLRLLEQYDIRDAEADAEEEGDISAGVVVPYRAQRGLMNSEIPDYSGVEVNTVEKFQGQERDMMVMSMVASDPGYVNIQSEFLLDPHRFNVAASRMKRKLIIVASNSIFQTSTTDADRYDEQSAWKQLYNRLGILDSTKSPDWSGSLSSFSPDEFGFDVDHETEIQVYHLNLEE